ncbi:DUF6244 family protein [Polymorphospora sp. NPDC050346]|uniref:DUF6244 family protein n=1 Tax=Polymorphospora sp. NPDC050346 TaxID=3155780 RepID=UPI003409C9FE
MKPNDEAKEVDVLVDAVRAEIEAIRAGTELAQRQASAADHVAQQIAMQAAASGFAAIAQNMAMVRDIIGQIRAGVRSLSTLAGDAATVVAAAPRQPTPEDTITTIGLLDQKLGDIHAGVGACIGRIDQTRQLTGAVLQGGDPGILLARLDAVHQALVAVAQRGATLRQRAQFAISEARAIGGAGNRAGWGRTRQGITRTRHWVPPGDGAVAVLAGAGRPGPSETTAQRPDIGSRAHRR